MGKIKVVIDVGDGGRTFVYVVPFDWQSFAGEVRRLPDWILGSLASGQLRDYAERFPADEAATV